jgi:hypothetical protein
MTNNEMDICLEMTDQIENSQGFCWTQIHRRVSFLLLPSKIPIASQGFDVEA